MRMPSRTHLREILRRTVSMPDIDTIIDDCFTELSREYEMEKANYLPYKDGKRKAKFPVWRIIVQASVAGKIEDIEIYIAFPSEFPYMMPYIYIFDDRFKYLPHISFESRKLCIYEDGIVYDANNIRGLIRDNICRARRWVELYSNQDNTAEYSREIRSYWCEQYEQEKGVETRWVLFGGIPEHTCELKAYSYQVPFLENSDKCFVQTVLFGNAEDEEFIIKNIFIRSQVITKNVLFIKSFSLPLKPPFSITGHNLQSYIEDPIDTTTFIKFINKHKKGDIIFPIGLDNSLGGVSVPLIKVDKRGYRPGMLNAVDVLTRYDYKNRNIRRIRVDVYKDERIAERTFGKMMEKKVFLVSGLGSIGSNLCYYLNGFNNAEFILVDPDILSIDNIGRHLLGFSYMNQSKVSAVAHFLTSYRPDRKVDVISENLGNTTIETFNRTTSIFLCTGDIMSERWLLSQMFEGLVSTPTFIFWLEPYGISGIMLYVNPSDKDSLIRVQKMAEKNFRDFCLIDSTEYENEDKLIRREAGCNGQYALYSANDVTLFLSAMFPYIDSLITTPSESKAYRWAGNLEIAKERNIQLVAGATGFVKHSVQEMPV